MGWYAEAPVWNRHWQCLWLLTYGTDIMNLREKRLRGDEERMFKQSYEFFSRYAGYRDARDSLGAWRAWRDGLDYSDTKRFEERAFGPVSGRKNLNRIAKITEAFRPFGAMNGDIKGYLLTGHPSRNMKTLNDVAADIWPDNYRMFLYQYAPNQTSQGYWRIGSKDEPYGRFARGFDHKTGKDAMYFNIDDGFFQDKPLAGEYPVTVRVVYFDKGTGSWPLVYDGVKDPQQTACTVAKSNSGTWKEKVVTISDGYFGNHCPNQTDLMLKNTDNEDDILHMVEIARTTGDRKGFWGVAP
ncbi:MAG: hypothetical protein NTW86_23240 [Candidatus Sumerlaeota bacterium]|nr:hypothetical protein [Candidatus Sumerlaeota bacterium]